MAENMLQLNYGVFIANLEEFFLHFEEQTHICIVQKFLTERRGYIW